MAGSFAYSRDADVAASAREQLDRTAALVASMESVRREMLAELIGLWPTSAWLVAGAASAKAWLLAYTNLSEREALRMAQLAGLCAAHPALAEAVVSGVVPLGRAERLSRFVTRERAPFLAGALDTFLDLNANTTDEDAFDEALRYWAARVDEQLPARRVQTHSLVLVPALFGGGQIHGQLAPVAFETVKTAIGAWTQDPDPKDAPYQRTLSERQADALDDLAQFALTHDPDHTHDLADDDAAGDGDDGIDWEDLAADDTFDGSYPGDEFDEALAVLDHDDDTDTEVDDETDDGSSGAGEGRLDPMVLLRRRLRRAEKHRRRRLRRRTRMRSGVTTNVHIDLRTLAGLRDVDDLDDLILRGDGWNLTKHAAEQLLCDSQMVVTLFDGKTRILDANEAAEQFSRSQRRALAARDGHCVFPSCTRPPRHCDAHHVHPRGRGGPTRVDNGALLCRFHHRLIHIYGWNLLIDDTGHWTAIDPHGNTWTGRPTTIAPTPTSPPDRRPTDQDAA